MRYYSLSYVFGVLMVCSACGSTGNRGSDVYPISASPDSVDILVGAAVVSACGGLIENQESIPPGHAQEFAIAPASDEYCRNEVLSWSYDANAQTLTVLDSRAVLNCCGVHTTALDDSTDVSSLVMVETDDLSGGECNCACVFDFGIRVENVVVGVVDLTLRRTTIPANYYPDATPSTSEVWSGELDLSAGNGDIVLVLGGWSCD